VGLAITAIIMQKHKLLHNRGTLKSCQSSRSSSDIGSPNPTPAFEEGSL
jgi:hypothetical protein